MPKIECNGEVSEFREGERVTLEELETRCKRAFDEAKEALITTATLMEESSDEARAALEAFSEASLKVVQATVDYHSYKGHVDTIERLLKDPQLTIKRDRIKKHRRLMHWIYLEGNAIPLPANMGKQMEWEG
ncbi:MAG: hypothetical protein RDV48_04580 [Candidatus Eremiobacteraeota bacterium]|nr:hypothetical protein [Candidatus Eremiobacteraeota bacterium]